MIQKMKIWMTGLLTVLLTVLFNYNADARGCGCRTRMHSTHSTYGYHRGYRNTAVRHHVYYRPFYGYRHGNMHAKKYKLKVKYE